jgi:arginyl-tRNA synthetase
MAAARRLETDPRELAKRVVAAAKLDDLAEKVEVAGPGFVNVTLKDDFLARQLAAAVGDKRLGVPELARSERQKVVVDYSGPNLAKEMHVGHLRSTIIGDALARTLQFLGHEVTRQNHVGDWGTQFGMLIAYMDEITARSAGSAAARCEGCVPIGDLEEFYRDAKQLFDSDATFAEKARSYVVKLQSGEEHCLSRWNDFRRQSLDHCDDVYSRLGVLLEREDVRGESAYDDDLPKVVADLKAAKLLAESEGAQCVFLDEFKDRDGNILPVIVRKSDGGFLYATTDLAALRYRVRRLKADRILYVHDARQTLHFRQVFAVARKAGFVPDGVSLEHVGFGTVMGSDGRPFRTREGGTIKLMDLLDEAERRAFELVTDKNPDLPEPRRREIARVVGIGAVKYADLAQNRTSDYVFSWNKMLSLDGNTAPYMQYAYARIRSIFRKGGRESAEGKAAARDRVPSPFAVREPAERALAVKLLQLPEVVETVAVECLPSLLCAYLFGLAGAFMGFYETCPVLQSDEPLRSSRLGVCELAAGTIQTGLNLLGIETLEQM